MTCPEAGPAWTAAWPTHEEVRAALLTLPARQRLAIVLRYVHGLTDAEIGAALGCREGTAASLLSRGRARLRTELRPDDDGDTWR